MKEEAEMTADGIQVFKYSDIQVFILEHAEKEQQNPKLELS